jgi:hypothetical protein
MRTCAADRRYNTYVGQQLSVNFETMTRRSYSRAGWLICFGLLLGTAAHSQTSQFGTASVSGRVIDADSTPAFQMEVRVARADIVAADPDAIFAKDRIFSYVDQNGTYKLNHLPAGRYIVVANADFRRPYAVTFHPGVKDLAYAAAVTVDEDQEVQNINILLDRPSLMLRSIEGVCVWEDGRPAADARINLLIAKYPWIAPASIGTDKNGSFTLHGYEGIEYLVDLPDYFDGKKPRVDPVKVSPKAGVNRVRLVLHPR